MCSKVYRQVLKCGWTIFVFCLCMYVSVFVCVCLSLYVSVFVCVCLRACSCVFLCVLVCLQSLFSLLHTLLHTFLCAPLVCLQALSRFVCCVFLYFSPSLAPSPASLPRFLDLICCKRSPKHRPEWPRRDRYETRLGDLKEIKYGVIPLKESL